MLTLIRSPRFAWPRKTLWCCLALSSVPLHLMYNSVIFSSTSLTEPLVFVVTDGFLTGAPYAFPTTDYFATNGDRVVDRLQRLRNSTTTSFLDAKACSKAYGSTMLISEWGDALAVTTPHSTNNSLLWTCISELYQKPICSGPRDDVTCQGGTMTYQNIDQVGPTHFNISISHCLAEQAHQRCRIRFSTGLMSGVIACNILKIICMGYMVWRLDPRPLVTVGDALASFLQSPGQ